jgi:predicted metalloprotease
MKWRRRESGHLDDLRGSGGGRGMALPIGAGGGVVGIVVLLLVTLLGGGGGSGSGGLGDVLDQLPGAVPSAEGDQSGVSDDPDAPDPNAEEAAFVEFLTEDIQAVWADEFQRGGETYDYARVNLFTGQVSTACGGATSAVGPFYCPADSEVYIDLDFFRELRTRFGAPGDFAQAYVVAHEIGHHVQNELGISERVRREEQSASSEEDANRWSVRLELQADCLAGVWAHSVYARGDLEPGDIEEGLAAAQAVGDDRIQEQAGMDISPETWTHGSSAQRQEWFDRGFQSGSSDDCDTFSADL